MYISEPSVMLVVAILSYYNDISVAAIKISACFTTV